MNAGGPFDTDGYVTACARHTGTEPEVLSAHGVVLRVLRDPDGCFTTVYGYPQPLGDTTSEALQAFADAVADVRAPLRIALSPLGAGGRLANELRQRLPVMHSREVCVADLDGEPEECFGKAARAKVRRALRAGATVEVTGVRPDFGWRYRAAMEELAADAVYHFDDAYFRALPAADVFQATVRDDEGPAASALFLCRGGDASYHLSARRSTPPGVPGAVNVAILEGLRECARREAGACVLGGGLGASRDDPLFRFKAGMATRTLPRPTFAATSRVS